MAGASLRFAVKIKHFLDWSHPMTLGRRLVIINAAFITAIAFIGGASLWGMIEMRSDVQALMYEHQELRLIDEVSINIAEVMGTLRDEFPNREFLLPRLAQASERAQILYDMQLSEHHANPEHGRRELELIQQTLRGLEALRGQLTDPTGVLRVWRQQTTIAEASNILDSLNALAAETLAEVQASRRMADSTIGWTITITLSICVALIIAAVLLGLAQYRVVTGPLRRLQAGVRRVANGQFDRALATEGDGEFVELAVDFNRMAGELQTLYHNLEEKVAQRSRQLVRSERLASVGFLAAGVAHEINNPLGIISTYAELSIRDMDAIPPSPTTTQLRESLQVMRDEAFRCKEITQKLLSLSRMGDGSRGPVSIRKCVDDVIAMVSKLPKFIGRKITSTFDLPLTLTVHGNEAELKQVVLNLLVNAMEAVKPGGQVRVEGNAAKDLVELRIIDDGCGMTAQTIEQVFEPFFTRKQSNGEHGSGLGLSICHAIVESHHGRIMAQSEGLGKGSRFIVQLPRESSPVSQRQFEVIHE